MIPKVEDGNNFGVSIQEVNIYKLKRSIKVIHCCFYLGFISRSPHIRNRCNAIS
jgi:hypothetical protein